MSKIKNHNPMKKAADLLPFIFLVMLGDVMEFVLYLTSSFFAAEGNVIYEHSTNMGLFLLFFILGNILIYFLITMIASGFSYFKKDKKNKIFLYLAVIFCPIFLYLISKLYFLTSGIR
jgi:hypothetical protein